MDDRKHRVTLRILIATAVAAMTLAAPAAAKELDALEAQLDLAWPRENVEVEGADFWAGQTGPAGPIFSGPQQPVFICTTIQQGFGNPLVDNQAGRGFMVFNTPGVPASGIAGWSENCSMNTVVRYFYRAAGQTGDNFTLLPAGPLPTNIVNTTTSDGLTVPYIVRQEIGTINRFIYSIATLAPFPDARPGQPNMDAWNKKLIYHFDGGVGIGHQQGSLPGRARFHEGLRLGYAVAYSTGTRTSTHYNLVLGGETAVMVKAHFVEKYGQPLYTVGVGASGGGIQQYVYGQNHPGLIDAAVAQYSYPDMLTQSIPVGDCELLEHYFDVTDAANPQWATWTNRMLIEGMAASNSVINTWKPMIGLPGTPGSTECIRGWRGLTPTVFNPEYKDAGYLAFQPLFDAADWDAVNWSHWDEARNVYGVDAYGFGRNTWDNVGVQYGLRALKDGTITKAEFLSLNAKIGGWKHPKDMVVNRFPWNGNPATPYDPWDSTNMTLSPDGGVTPAPRTSGDMEGIRRAYEAGHVFVGRIDMPIIDVRHYLEPELDMHNSRQSFSARQRMIDAKGHADNQAIWSGKVIWTGSPPTPQNRVSYDPTPRAFAVIDVWMANIRANPGLGVAGNKPASAQDLCFDEIGSTIAEGADVWDGILNNNAPGACAARLPPYSSSRIVAGERVAGDTFKCRTIPVAAAMGQRFYGNVRFTREERARLEQIFPTGVCNYSLPAVRWSN
jgi:hypothetical protein